MDEIEEILRQQALQDEIIKRLEAGERNFSGIDFTALLSLSLKKK